MNVPVETVLEYDIRKKRYITLYFKGYTGMRIRHFFHGSGSGSAEKNSGSVSGSNLKSK